MSTLRLQAMHFLWLLLYMKRWKYLWVIFVFLTLISNHFLFPIVDSWLGTLGQTYVEVGAKQFVSNNLILVDAFRDKEKLVNLRHMLPQAGSDMFENCANDETCKAKMFSILYGRIDTNKFTNYISYNTGKISSNESSHTVPSIQCQMAFGGELHCPYLGNLAAVSQHDTEKNYGFEDVKFFSLIGRQEGKKANSKAGQATMCANNENMEAVYSRTIMLQCMLIVCSVSFYYLVSMQACIAELKRDGFLQLLFQKGLSVQAYWFVIGMITVAEVAAFVMIYIISLAVQCPNFFNPLHMVAVFFMALFYMLSITALALLISVSFANYFYIGLLTVVSAILSMLLILVNRLVLSTIIWAKFLLLLVYPPGHFGEFVQGVMLSEIRFENIGFYNITILLITILLPILLCFAIFLCDFTRSTGNGFCLPLDFLRDSAFWADPKPVSMDERDDPLYGKEPEPCANVEPVADGLKPLVRMSQLSKTFVSKQIFQEETSVPAIKDMSALIYENHITAIIGHNGAGKTTLLNLLTGAETPTTGQVSICGVLASCRLNRQRLRGKLGICPQAMSFASSLTVEQTLQLTVVSCGHEWIDCKEEVESILKILSMKIKNNVMVGRLSVGQQRKLAVCMALLGNPMVVFLDEPTSGLDPESRRCMWKLLQKYRMGRSIIMSTQFMDEADTLADRKIFLSSGSLICAGSSLFLKSAFDCGFVFDVSLKNEKHASLLKRQICEEFASVKAKNRFGTNIKFHLPARDVDHLPTLAQAFEKRTDLISAFGLLQASLYDIFMRLKDMDAAAVEAIFDEDRSGHIRLEESERVVNESTRMSRMTINMGETLIERTFKLSPSFYQQLRALVIVNLIRMIRTRVRLACRAIIPACLLVMLIIMAIVERTKKNHELHLRTNMTFLDSFERGVCVLDEIKTRKVQLMDSKRCSEVFCRGFLKCPLTAMGAETRYLALKKDPETSLAKFLQLNETVSQIEKICRSRRPQNTLCPIIYAFDWSLSAPNLKRSISVGSYTIYEKLNSSIAALISMGVFQTAIKYFIDESTPTNDTFAYTAESVYDCRSTFIPTLGTFFQLLILSLIPATFLDDIIEDKQSKVRSQLTSMGMNCLSYWLNNFLIHWVQYAMVYSLTVLALLIIVQTGYSTAFYMAGVFLPTLFFGLSSNQLMVYVLSTIMDRANYLVTIMYFFFSIVVATVIMITQLNNVLSVILIALVPPYAVVALTFYGVKILFYTLAYHETNNLNEISTLPKNFFFTQPHMMASFVAIIVHAAMLLAVLVLLENRLLLQQRFESYVSPQSKSLRAETHEDPGVLEETTRINENPRNPENLMEARQLSKTYPDGTKVVREISFATGPAEISGLLGPNGAGKTTALNMIVGQLKATAGRCEVRHNDAWLPSGLAASRGLIGYCPQFDPLYDCLTPVEHLQFYANVMGVPPTSQNGHLAMLTDMLSLDTKGGKLSSQLSVGNRRRLSLAISLLGEPTVIVIDEATTGVDPEGKRFLWQAIRKAANIQSTVVITTHSMEEVEALCNKVMVINRGLMVGLGTVQQLRTRYGRSYCLEILINTVIGEDPDETQFKKHTLISSVQKKFADTVIIEEFNDRVKFSIPTTSIARLSHALGWLVDNKKALRIHYFSFCQMSMDQVFERIVKLHDRRLKSERRSSMFSLSSDEGEDDSKISIFV